eukprot:jgi/Tetstr1/453578/TSEL_040546.t1
MPAHDAPSSSSSSSAAGQTAAEPAALHGPEDLGKIDLNDFFSLRKPKDVKAGLASGLKSMATGVCAGALGLVVAPIVGGFKDGAKGALCGLGAGALGAVVLPVTGVVIGTTQMVRGLINTPEAIMESSRGKIWNHDVREWTEWHVLALPDSDEADASPGVERLGAGRASTPKGGGSGGEYYELLDVSPGATEDEIRKQYYLLARKWHPDKRPGDPEAKLRFQKLGEAYQVLSSPALRARYDQGGTDSVDANFVDPSLFFSMLFGNEKFEFLVGELMITSLARLGGSMSAKQMARQQMQREAALVVNLRALLRRYVEGDVEGFRVAMTQEAATLVSQSYGEQLLPCIGEAFRMQAEIYLGNVFMSTVSRVAYQVNMLKSQLNGATAAFRVFKAQQDMEAAARKAAAEEGADAARRPAEGEADDAAASSDREQSAAERAKMEDVALPIMLDAMWAANAVDIQSTLRNVCSAVLQDKDASAEVRRRRTEALHMLGAIFQAAEVPESLQRTPKDNVTSAMQRVIHKQHNLEPSEEDAHHFS